MRISSDNAMKVIQCETYIHTFISQDLELFSLTNGTRQGSVLSPYLFAACYLDDLLVKLRTLGLGCHIAGLWMGATGFADDLALLSTGRQELQKMVTICQEYGAEHNLVFSTDPNPARSKTKCILFSISSRTRHPESVI